MHKVILMMLLAVVSSSAMAKWVKVDEDKLVTAYADPTTIRKNGDKVKMWALWDYSTAQEGGSKPYMSVRIQNEYNCKEETIRQIFATTFSGNMAGGHTINSQGGRPGLPVSQCTPTELLWTFACGK